MQTPFRQQLACWWVDRFGIPDRPRWLSAIIDDHLTASISASLAAANADGIGHHYAWAEPNEGAATLLPWFDDQMQRRPGGISSASDYLQLGLVAMDAATCTEFKAGSGVYTLSETPHFMWDGTPVEWWQTGRDALLVALPAAHDGLLLYCNSAQMVLRHFLPPPPPHPATAR